jgi:hypothetical protein
MVSRRRLNDFDPFTVPNHVLRVGVLMRRGAHHSVAFSQQEIGEE